MDASTMLNGAIKSKYEVGQVWSYQTRTHEFGSTFTVVGVEVLHDSTNLIHISVTGLKMKYPYSADGYTDTVQHLPIPEAALDKSKTELLREGAELPDYEASYNAWRGASDEGLTGIHNLPLAQMIDYVEAQYEKNFQPRLRHDPKREEHQ